VYCLLVVSLARLPCSLAPYLLSHRVFSLSRSLSRLPSPAPFLAATKRVNVTGMRRPRLSCDHFCTHVRRARAFFPIGAEYFDTDLDGTGGGEEVPSFASYVLPNVRARTHTHCAMTRFTNLVTSHWCHVTRCVKLATSHTHTQRERERERERETGAPWLCLHSICCCMFLAGAIYLI
jgi:hypothetical protein